MDIGPDTRKVTNPARTAARKQVATAQCELIAAERALPQLLAGHGTPKQKNAALPGTHRRIETATAALEQAKTAPRPVPAKVAATELDPTRNEPAPTYPAPRPADGAAAARIHRRSVAGGTLQRLPDRPQRPLGCRWQDGPRLHPGEVPTVTQ